MKVERAKSGRRWVLRVLLAMGLVIAAWGGRNVYSKAHLGVAFVAKQTCSCLFVAGRTAQSCSKDYDAQAVRALSVKTEPSAITVTALAGLVRARAEFETDFGCHLVD